MLKKILLSCVVLFFLIVTGTHISISKEQKLDNQTIIIAKGSYFSTVIETLEKKAFIASTFWIKVYAKYYGLDSQIKYGRYLFDGKYSAKSILEKIIAGDVEKNRFTIIEGWNFKDLKNNLLQQKNLKIKELKSSRRVLAKKLNLPEAFLDGAFLAETYFYLDGSTALDLLRRAHKQLKLAYTKIKEQSNAKDKYLQSLRSTVSLAAIIEKETAKKEELELISSVFHNRLKKNMFLQSDPTVIYAAGDSYKGNITNYHLRKKHSHNTYVNKGLPPYPIALIGIEAIYAAFNPAFSDYLFFVAKGDGYHEFNINLKEHNKAVRKFLR